MRLSLAIAGLGEDLLGGRDILFELIGDSQIAIRGIESLGLLSGKRLVENAELVDLALEAGHIAYVLVLADDELHHAGRQILSPATVTDL